MASSDCDRTYKWMSYKEAAAYLKEAERKGVSTVSRTKGFMHHWKRTPSVPSFCRQQVPGERITWGRKRRNFIARHLKQYQKACAGGRPCARERQWLAMVMWGYKARKLH